jgi:hypothetical protein
MRREIRPEILDSLPAGNPHAIQSRRDLRKVNAFMGHAGVITRALQESRSLPRTIVELGAGDGSLLLKVARRLPRPQTRVRAVLVDFNPSVSADTCAAFRTLGWDIETRKSDVFEWLLRADVERADVTIANLFLHHFRDAELTTLFAAASRQTSRFVACEPRRSAASLAGASLLILIGCNTVTRHDATISVRAGFDDRELSALWPNEQGWKLTESRVGLFSHWFDAKQYGLPF